MVLRPPSWAQRTEHDEPDVRVGGAQWVLGRAAVHGAVELGGNPLQHQLPPVELGAAVQEAAPDPRPCEQGLWEDLVLLARAGEVWSQEKPFCQSRGGSEPRPGQAWGHMLIGWVRKGFLPHQAEKDLGVERRSSP